MQDTSRNIGNIPAANRVGRGGFTLVELLVVLAITSLLAGLMLGPLMNSFSITERTRVNVRAQEAARATLEQVTREIQSAIFVYDNTGQALSVPVGGVVFEVPHSKLDLVPARVLMHCNAPDHPSQEPRDYPRGDLAWPACPFSEDEDPATQSVEARPLTPLSADETVIRYFIGLRDNEAPYNSSHTDQFAIAGQPDNTFLLYRAEFRPNDPDLMDNSGGQDGFSRPDFFYNTKSAPNGRTFAQNWKAIAKAVGPVKDVDLVTVEYQGTVPVSVAPSIKFVPNVVTNDVLSPTDIGRQAEGEPVSPPTTYRATNGQWAPTFQVRLYRDINDDTPSNDVVYYTGRTPAGNLVIKRGSDVVFDITAWTEGRTLVPPDPEMMFTVDANKGQVDFAIPMPYELWDSTSDTDGIPSLNKAVAEAAAHNAGALRMVTLNPPLPLGPDSLVRVVPGSERVLGPDWTVGPGYGAQIQYTRVASLIEDPGPNQYRINYKTGEVVFYSLPRPIMPEGAAGLEISYSVQTNQGFDSTQGDILSADYKSKNLLTVHVAYRIFDDRSKPQQTALTNSVLVRNFHR